MAIEKMKRLRLVAVKSERERLLDELMLLGCVHISEPGDPLPGSPEEALLSKEASGLFERKAEYEKLIAGLEVLNKYAFAKSGLFVLKPEVSVQSVMDGSSLEESLALSCALLEAEEKIKRLSAEESRLKGLIETLKPWEMLDIPFDRTETKSCFVAYGLIPAAVSLSEVETALYSETDSSQLFLVGADRNAHYLVLIAMKQDRQQVLELLRRFGFAPSSAASMTGTARENIKAFEKKLAELADGKEALSKQISAAAAHRDDMKLCADRLLTQIERADNAERLLCSEATVSLEGWIPANREKQLGAVLGNFSCAWETAEPVEADMPEVPIKLRNNGLTAPFSMLTEMYNLPAYNGIDPNPFLSVFFPMFFGIMMADLGYGIIIFLGGLFIKLKTRPKGSAANMPGLLMVCGFSTALFGTLSGSFFGDSIAKVSSMYGSTVSVPALIDPLNDPLQVLIAALAIGFFQLIVGTAVNGYMLIRDGHWFDALCDVGSLWLLFAGIALGAMGITWYAAYAGLAAVVLTQGRSSPSIGGKLGGGLFALYNIASGWFGDVLSYCRLMALMLAGAVIASVFNTLGTLTGNIVGFTLLFLVGHALNLALNVIGAFVHSLRLQYLEFFGKFYKEGGIPFRPLAIKTNYFNIIEED